jgi:hypothetical protein
MAQLAGASIVARTDGAVAQYQLSGEESATIGPYDSGTILGTVPPGKAGLKLINGTIQNATTLTASAAAGKVGNALLANQNGQGYTTDPFTQSAGLSLSPEHE